MSTRVIVGYCGVCCNHCGMHMRIPGMASDLRRFIEAYGYGEWIGKVTQDFDFDNFLKGLKWFANSSCPGCLEGGGMSSCDVRACCLERRLSNCYFCEEFSRCERLRYQKETYRIEEHYARINQVGYEKWLREQEKNIEEKFDNIEYLGKRGSI